ncbi:hypothetical protein ACLKA6_006589 [Drosophila palustris]
MNVKPKLVFNLDAYEKDPDIRKKENQLSRLKEIGCFSLSSERFYRRGGDEIKILVMPGQDCFPLDLNKQFAKLWEADIYAEYLDNMLYFIRDNKDLMLKRVSPRRVEVQADIITHSELLQVLKCTIYSKQNWRIFGTKFLGTFYLCLGRPSQKEVTSEASQIKRTCQIWETKLKRFLYSDTPEKQTLNSQLDEGQFYKVFQSKMGEFSVIYGSPMGARCNQRENLFTDCKVMPPQSFIDDNSGISEPYLELSWWSECSLNGVEEIHVARPNTSGHVEAIEKKLTISLITKNSKNWSINKCNNSMLHILRQICSNIKVNNPDTIYEFEYDSNSRDLNFKPCFLRNENTFISDWYRSMLKDRVIVNK